VVVDLSSDMTRASGPSCPQSVSIRGYDLVARSHPGQIKKAASALRKARKPLFYVGGGLHISGACEIFRSWLFSDPVRETWTNVRYSGSSENVNCSSS
jgi:acetolactate synthase-1/2/3 large subunit